MITKNVNFEAVMNNLCMLTFNKVTILVQLIVQYIHDIQTLVIIKDK